MGPPRKWKERRVTVEQRLPEVKEIAYSEWLKAAQSFINIDGATDNDKMDALITRIKNQIR